MFAAAKKPSKHDQYVLDLLRAISPRYDRVKTHVDIKKKKRKVAEIDLLAKKGGKFDVYEVKCSNRIVKAKQQAKKIRKHTNIPINNVYFFCGSSGELITI